MSPLAWRWLEESSHGVGRTLRCHGRALFLAIAVAWSGPAASLPIGAPPHAPLSLWLAQAGRHADPALEALLPTALGGVSLTIESQAGTELSTQSAAFDAFLGALGKTRADFSLASAYARGLKAQVGAWQ